MTKQEMARRMDEIAAQADAMDEGWDRTIFLADALEGLHEEAPELYEQVAAERLAAWQRSRGL